MRSASAASAASAAAAAASALLLLSASAAHAARVLFIGLDGFGGDWLLEADTPNMQALMANGTWTLNMQNVLSAASSQNWFSMVGGAGPDQHGVYTNDWERGDSVQTPSMFQVVRDNMPNATIGAFYHWSGFGRLVEDFPVIDVKESPGDERATTDAAIAYLKAEQPDLLFVHLDHVDAAGHGTQWGSPEYIAAVGYADQLVGEFIAALSELGLLEETTIFINTDHGGGRTGHGNDQSSHRNIPFIVSGPGINQNVQVTREVRVFDTSATVVEVFGFARPASWIATPVYEAFRTFVPPAAPTTQLRYQFVSEYEFIYDTTGENPDNLLFGPFSTWRPVAPAGFFALSDVTVRGLEAPTFSVPVVFDDSEILSAPAASERIWGNGMFVSKDHQVTYWQPIPHYGFVCPGTYSVADISAVEPERSLMRCIHHSFLLQAEGVIVGRNAGYSQDPTLSYGAWMSLWNAEHPTGAGIDLHAFIARRDLLGPGYNKFYVLDDAKASRIFSA